MALAIRSNKLLLAEGADDVGFIRGALAARSVPGVQVGEYGGKKGSAGAAGNAVAMLGNKNSRSIP